MAAAESGRFRDPAPIGFYFARLWYYERLYPRIFTLTALGQAARVLLPPTRPNSDVCTG
jgi:squalene-hopene/tetraprenyl-beta-curcumene cyclase